MKLRMISMVFAAATILANISWTLVTGHNRDLLTITGVITFAISSCLHAYSEFGIKFLRKLVSIVVLAAFAIEAIGVASGIPFGSYEYSQTRLGPTLLEVPLLIPFAWLMMIYPALLVARDFKFSLIPTLSIAALLMATWDLYLDPQMVSEGYWTWFADGNPTSQIPVTNFFGWVISAALIYLLLIKFSNNELKSSSPSKSPLSQAPYLLILWVWLGSFLANVVTIEPFLGKPAVAWQGFIGMGIILLPWLRQLLVARRMLLRP